MSEAVLLGGHNTLDQSIHHSAFAWQRGWRLVRWNWIYDHNRARADYDLGRGSRLDRPQALPAALHLTQSLPMANVESSGMRSHLFKPWLRGLSGDCLTHRRWWDKMGANIVSLELGRCRHCFPNFDLIFSAEAYRELIHGLWNAEVLETIALFPFELEETGWLWLGDTPSKWVGVGVKNSWHFAELIALKRSELSRVAKGGGEPESRWIYYFAACNHRRCGRAWTLSRSSGNDEGSQHWLRTRLTDTLEACLLQITNELGRRQQRTRHETFKFASSYAGARSVAREEWGDVEESIGAKRAFVGQDFVRGKDEVEEQFSQDLQADVETVSDDLFDSLDHVQLLPEHYRLRSAAMAIFYSRRRKLQSDQLDGLHKCWTFLNLLRRGHLDRSLEILALGGWSEHAKKLDDDGFIGRVGAPSSVDDYFDLCSELFQTSARWGFWRTKVHVVIHLIYCQGRPSDAPRGPLYALLD